MNAYVNTVHKDVWRISVIEVPSEFVLSATRETRHSPPPSCCGRPRKCAGNLPPPEANGRRYLKIPLTLEE